MTISLHRVPSTTGSAATWDGLAHLAIARNLLGSTALSKHRRSVTGLLPSGPRRLTLDSHANTPLVGCSRGFPGCPSALWEAWRLRDISESFWRSAQTNPAPWEMKPRVRDSRKMIPRSPGPGHAPRIGNRAHPELHRSEAGPRVAQPPTRQTRAVGSGLGWLVPGNGRKRAN